MQIKKDAREALLLLPSLFGGREVLERARGLTADEDALSALTHLKKVYELLCEFGYEKYLTIDLGMLHKLGYYTGIIFRGISHEIGFPILSGGRYDSLMGEFGEPMPAIGFALGIKRALIVLERQGGLRSVSAPQAAVISDRASASKAYGRAEELRRQGIATRLYFSPDRELQEALLAKKEITELFSWKDNEETVLKWNEGGKASCR